MASVPQQSSPSAPPRRADTPRLRDPRRWVRRADTISRVIITTGGIGIIITVLLILIFIVVESLPLWRGARGGRDASLRFADAEFDPVLLAFPDPYRETYVVLRATGRFQQVDRKTAKLLGTTRLDGLQGSRITFARRIAGRDVMGIGLEDGRMLVVEGKVSVEFSPRGREIDFSLGPVTDVQVLPEGRPIRFAAAAPTSQGTALLASSGESDLYFVPLPAAEESDFPGTAAPAPLEPVDLSPSLAGEKVTSLAMSEEGDEAAVGTEQGVVIPLTIADGEPSLGEPIIIVEGESTPVTAAAYLLGGQSLVLGDAKGRVTSWFRVRTPENPNLRVLRKIHTFASMPDAVSEIGISTRNKNFVTADRSGRLWLRHNTSEQTLLRLAGAPGPISDAGLAPQNDGAFALSANGVLTSFVVDNPHPEVTLKTLFGKVFYEGYEKPEFSWQSTGGTDDFESKFSLTPLIFGTLKATFYALLFAIPIAIAAALYAALFADPMVRRFIKPVVEIMAALPSVVIGFLAGLWLAPRVERTTVGTLLLLPLVPMVVIGCAILFRAIPQRIRVRMRPATEILLLFAIVIAAVYLSYRLGPALERTAFGGDFKAWLFENFQERYDPRNSLIIGFAMGFAVIPIIFTISEDAFSNVPAHLSAASLALGASRWQTAMRVVLPTASPGVFSAVMIGFGRAVGETMIVLMATGNTPIMEWSIFNGMRTLSANIAVEIPEAPFGGTLYRLLFFAAAILFVMTFCVNTAAEIVRQRLRRKYEFL